MGFTDEDRAYLKDAVVKPLQASDERLSEQIKGLDEKMAAHDNLTKAIEKTQDEWKGGLKVLTYLILPIAVSVITWYLTKP